MTNKLDIYNDNYFTNLLYSQDVSCLFTWIMIEKDLIINSVTEDKHNQN